MRLALSSLFALAMLGGCSLVVDDDPLGTQGGETSQPSATDTGTGETDPTGTGETDPVTTSPTTDETDPVTTSPTTDETDPVTTSPTTDETDPGSTDVVSIEGLSINDGAQYSIQLGVQLVSEVHNANQMRMRNDGGPWSAWVPFQAARPWSLAAIEGQRLVSVEYRFSSASPSSGASDTIILDRTAPDPPFVQLVGDYYTRNQTPQFEWSSNGGGIGEYRAKVDDESMDVDALYTTDTWATTPVLVDGQHFVYVQERDAAGNWSESGTADVHVDLSGPMVSAFAVRELLSGPDCQYSNGSNVYVVLAANDYGSGIQDMRLRNENSGWDPWSSYQESFAWQLLPGLGATSIELEIRDNLGNTNLQSVGVYRDDAYELCLGNDFRDNASVLGMVLNDDYEGTVLLNGNAVSQGLPDYFRINVPEWTGGTLEASRPAGSTGTLSMRIYDSQGTLIESGYESGTSVSVSVTGRNSTVETPLCDDCYCNDDEVYYYVEVWTNDASGYGQLYSMSFSGNTDACL